MKPVDYDYDYNYEYWDVGGYNSASQYAAVKPPATNLSEESTARVLKALVLLGGRMHNFQVDSESGNIVYRISLPVGSRMPFEKISSYLPYRSLLYGILWGNGGAIMKAYEFWDVGGVQPPNLGKTSTACVMQALIRLGGRLHDTDFDRDFDRDDVADQYRLVVYRISLPVGKREEFEKLAGYPLTRPAQIRAGA